MRLTTGEIYNCYEQDVSVVAPEFYGLPGNSRDWPCPYGSTESLKIPPGYSAIVDAECDLIAIVPTVCAETMVHVLNAAPRMLEVISRLLNAFPNDDDLAKIRKEFGDDAE